MKRQPKNIGVITVARSDYGIYRPVLRRIIENKNLSLRLIVAADHLTRRGGMSIRAIQADGFPVRHRVPMTPVTDTAEGVALAMARGLAGFAKIYHRHRPDLIMALGDRFEMYAAVAAAAPFCIPVAHLHGGELTEGAMDNQFRHSISKLSHLHFVATSRCRRRLLRMGEEPERIFVTGAPGLDNIHETPVLSRAELMAALRLPPSARFVLATFHPETLSGARLGQSVRAFLSALEECGLPVVFTAPNVDMGHRRVEAMIRAVLRRRPDFRLFANMGAAMYFAAMRFAQAMVGNSSSGIIEAASFRLPVVNIGDRQRGREHGRNVVDVPCRHEQILLAIRRVTRPDFRRGLAGLRNPYGNGRAAPRIVRVLENLPPSQELITKKFFAGSVR